MNRCRYDREADQDQYECARDAGRQGEFAHAHTLRQKPDGGRPGTRTRMDYSTRPSNVRVYQFRQPPS